MIPREGCFETLIGATTVCVEYIIFNVQYIEASFSYNGKPFEFRISGWSTRKWSKLYVRFHAVYSDSNLYGSSCSQNKTYAVSPDQLTTILVQITKDVFRYVDQVVRTHTNGILDYCAWYRDTHTNTNDYATWIQRLACKCILRTKMYDTTIPRETIPLSAITANASSE
jgi:hypothetical protein